MRKDMNDPRMTLATQAESMEDAATMMNLSE